MAPRRVRTLGLLVVSWVEHFLVHGPGDVQGQPIELDDEFTAFVCRCYKLNGNGTRCFDEAMLSRAKGRAKSELAGMIVCAEALGPVRFDHWAVRGETLTVGDWVYEFEPGEPVGRPVTYPFIRCLATEEEQAGHTFDNAAFMLDHVAESFGDVYPGIDIGRNANTSTRIFLPDGGEIRPSTASSVSKDGGKESFLVADETHWYVGRELHSMYDIAMNNLPKRKAAEPWGLQTTTAWEFGTGSVAEQTFNSHQVGELERVLVDHVASPEVDLADDDALLAALHVVYGPASGWMPLPRIMAQLRDPRKDPARQQRFFLNRVLAGSNKWVSAEQWDECADTIRRVVPGEQIAMGFDGGRTNDSTVLRGCRLVDGHLFTLGVWERPSSLRPGERWETPQQEVNAAVAAAMATYRVWRLYADPPHWRDEIDAWHGLWPDRVVKWETNRDTFMGRALERLHGAISLGAISHDGDRRVSRHYANVFRWVRGSAEKPVVLVRKETPDSPNKIDAVVADALAYEARNDAIAAEALKPLPRYAVGMS